MLVYLILDPESTRPEFGWNKQKARVSGLGSLRYAKYGYGLMAKGEPVALLKLNNPFSRSAMLGSKLPEDGGSDCRRTAMEWTVDTLIFPANPAESRAFWRFCIAGRSCDIRFRSLYDMTSLPTLMTMILEAGLKGTTLVSIQFLAKFGSDAMPGMSELDAPIMRPMPVLAKALITAGSDPYNRTFSTVEDCRSFAVASGGGRLWATWP